MLNEDQLEGLEAARKFRSRGRIIEICLLIVGLIFFCRGVFAFINNLYIGYWDNAISSFTVILLAVFVMMLGSWIGKLTVIMMMILSIHYKHWYVTPGQSPSVPTEESAE